MPLVNLSSQRKPEQTLKSSTFIVGRNLLSSSRWLGFYTQQQKYSGEIQVLGFLILFVTGDSDSKDLDYCNVPPGS